MTQWSIDLILVHVFTYVSTLIEKIPGEIPDNIYFYLKCEYKIKMFLIETFLRCCYFKMFGNFNVVKYTA
jgi:hypothetical protein